VLILHHSIGEPALEAWLEERPERLVLVYHNLSPAAMFEPFDPDFAALLELGRRQLERLRSRTDLAIGVSEYNAAELRGLGYSNVRVSPLVFEPRRLLGAEPDPSTTAHLANHVQGPMVLSVGQLLPHKRPDFLIHAFHILSTYLLPEAHLVVVGAARLRPYHRALQAQVDELNLSKVWLTGAVTDSALAAFYRRADVFASTSEHEGFCAPLLEAMAFDLPIVARRVAAIPETLGSPAGSGAGLLLEPSDGPAVFAEALAEILANHELAARLRDQGQGRLCDFSEATSGEIFLAHLSEVL
jgi:glycosyltransferase involved in cell wall biosynthesis